MTRGEITWAAVVSIGLWIVRPLISSTFFGTSVSTILFKVGSPSP